MAKKQINKIKLAIVHPSPYPVKLPIFEIVCAKADGVMLFSTKDSYDHPEWKIDEILKQYSFKHIFLPGFRIKRVDVRPSVFFYLIKYKPKVIVATEFNLQTIFCCIYAKLFKSKILIQSNATTHTDSIFTGRVKFRKWLIRQCDGFIANSSETRKYLCELGANPEKVKISIQTIDVNKWKDKVKASKQAKEQLKKDLDLRERVILCVSRLQPKKGINLLLDAFFNALEKLNNVSVVLVGTGPEESSLKEYCIQKGIMDKIKFVGYIQPMDMPKFYSLADIFVFPTLYDKFGLVAIEALASGLPVICSKYAGSAHDLIKDGENGYIVEPNDIAKMSDLLINVLNDKILLQKLKQNAFESADNFTVEKSAEHFLEAVNLYV